MYNTINKCFCLTKCCLHDYNPHCVRRNTDRLRKMTFSQENNSVQHMHISKIQCMFYSQESLLEILYICKES